MIFRPANRHLAVWALFAGLILRAATPLGYMPASPGNGLLFELCPGQLPAGFVLPGQTSTHEHHHHSTENNAPPEPDTCQIGHLLSSASAVGAIDTAQATDFQPGTVPTPPSIAMRFAAQPVDRSRGPPA